MSVDLNALKAKVDANPALLEKLKTAVTVDSAFNVLREAGIEVTKADLIRLQATKLTELSDAELEQAAGGNASYSWCQQSPDCI
jgi:predicted ribosomally synthesized peptide with nif11-like leader